MAADRSPLQSLKFWGIINRPPPNVSGASIPFVRDKPLLHRSSRGTSNGKFSCCLPNSNSTARQQTGHQNICKVVLHTPHMIGAPERRGIPQQTKFNTKPRRHLFHRVTRNELVKPQTRAAQARTTGDRKESPPPKPATQSRNKAKLLRPKPKP